MSTELPRENPLEVQEFLPRHWLMRRVTCPNPFYLLSAACVIHATAVPLKTSGRGLEPESLLGIVIGYAIVLALITIVIVRRWKVWDDARSNFFILLLLFLELALSSDGILQASPERGTRLLMIGLAAAIGVSELVLWSLRLKLAAVYRVPYYVQLALMFLYPLWLLPTLESNDGPATTWRIFAFPSLAGMTILALLPAVRRGPHAVEQNGSPWSWAWYPWTVLGALGGCLALRAYTLCLSFDAVRALRAEAAYRLENIFGPYFLAPMLLAAAVLVLEASRAAGNRLSGASRYCCPSWLSRSHSRGPDAMRLPPSSLAGCSTRWAHRCGGRSWRPAFITAWVPCGASPGHGNWRLQVSSCSHSSISVAPSACRLWRRCRRGR